MASISIEIMILGALFERPMSAYEMDKAMEERNIRRWTSISSPSIYRNLLRVCEQGYVDGAVVKESEMPEKTVYTINDKGRARFEHLMKEAAHAPAQLDFDYLPVTSNLAWVDEALGKELLDHLITSHREAAEAVKRAIDPDERIEARATKELCSAAYRLSVAWLENFKRDFYRTS